MMLLALAHTACPQLCHPLLLELHSLLPMVSIVCHLFLHCFALFFLQFSINHVSSYNSIEYITIKQTNMQWKRVVGSGGLGLSASSWESLVLEHHMISAQNSASSLSYHWMLHASHPCSYISPLPCPCFCAHNIKEQFEKRWSFEAYDFRWGRGLCKMTNGQCNDGGM